MLEGGGYDREFVDDLKNSLLCPVIGLLVPKKPANVREMELRAFVSGIGL